MDKSNAWRSVAQDIKLSAAKEAVKAMRSLQAIIQYIAQICFEESLLNWKPLPSDWAATTSKPKEVQDNTLEDNMYRYNRKGFLEDDDSSDDLIFIIDPGWDDYCLQELKLNHPVPCCPDARRARISKPTSTDLANNLACVYNHLNLFSKVALKNYNSISKKQKELESRVQSCQEKLESCEELLRKTQSETRKSLQHISTEIQQSKPLTKREVLNLVQEIVEQPKLVEKEALRLTEDLNQKIQKVEHLLHEVKKLITRRVLPI
ncbi:Orf y [Tanacetum coccineum]